MKQEPLKVWEKIVPNTWIDYNSHMTEGYYGVAFAEASDEFLIHIGFTSDYREAKGTFYTVEAQIRFLEEVKEGSLIYTQTFLIGFDSKRLHINHELFANEGSSPVATQEAMLLHVSKIDGVPSASTIENPIASNLLELSIEHSEIERPSHLGNGIRQL